MSGRSTCEMCQSIDVRLWRRNGQLHPGLHFPYSWTRDGESMGSISVRIAPKFAHLAFMTCDPEVGEWKSIEQYVPVVWTPCHLGGGRPWFLCEAIADGVRCGRRVAKLYLGAASGFACRRCYGLLYASQFEALNYRGLGKARKIRMQVGGDTNLLVSFPLRPKRMHRRTYERLREQYGAAAVRCGLG
jgi:hypothetical protein